MAFWPYNNDIAFGTIIDMHTSIFLHI